MTLTEKILAKAAGKAKVKAGENVWVKADTLMTHDEGGRRVRWNAFAAPDMHVGVADAASLKPHQYLTGAGDGTRHTGDLERFAVTA